MDPGIDYIGLGVGAFILNDKGEVLLMKRGALAKNEVGHWTIPGGKVEFGETLRKAVLREAREEIGVELELDKQMPATDHILTEEGQHWVTNLFPAHIKSGTPKNLEPGKCDQIGWFALDNLPTPLSLGLQAMMNSFLNL